MTTDRDVQGEALLHREEEKKRRNEARAESYKENMIQAIARLLKQEEIRRGVENDFVQAGQNPVNANDVNNVFNKARAGSYGRELDDITGNEFLPGEEEL